LLVVLQKDSQAQVRADAAASLNACSGLVAAEEATQPFEHCDVVSTTTHKSLRGPRAGMIFFRRVSRFLWYLFLAMHRTWPTLGQSVLLFAQLDMMSDWMGVCSNLLATVSCYTTGTQAEGLPATGGEGGCRVRLRGQDQLCSLPLAPGALHSLCSTYKQFYPNSVWLAFAYCAQSCLQGGPHNHQIAALAVALKHAQTPQFKQYQIQVGTRGWWSRGLQCWLSPAALLACNCCCCLVACS
jgi:Serine hydroxymethyltransferase